MAKNDNNKNELALDIASWDIRDKIYEIRGQKVMLDYDLAKYYGYETRYLNRQVKNNASKFQGENFMFQLARSELNSLVMCKNFTSPKNDLFSGQSGGTRKLPYAFTEQGIYMLMTVLKGELATKQSRALVMTFKAMKDYIVDNQKTLEYRGNLELAMKVANNSEDIAIMKSEIKSLNEKKLAVISEMKDTGIVGGICERVGRMCKNPELKLGR